MYRVGKPARDTEDSVDCWIQLWRRSNDRVAKTPVSERGTVPIFGPGAAPLMDSNQAAEFLGVHPRTLQRMVLRGQIAGVRVGKLWRFVPSAIQDWIAEHNIAS
jgi:excisionase family DNA binding protein